MGVKWEALVIGQTYVVAHNYLTGTAVAEMMSIEGSRAIFEIISGQLNGVSRSWEEGDELTISRGGAAFFDVLRVMATRAESEVKP